MDFSLGLIAITHQKLDNPFKNTWHITFSYISSFTRRNYSRGYIYAPLTNYQCLRALFDQVDKFSQPPPPAKATKELINSPAGSLRIDAGVGL